MNDSKKRWVISEIMADDSSFSDYEPYLFETEDKLEMIKKAVKYWTDLYADPDYTPPEKLNFIRDMTFMVMLEDESFDESGKNDYQAVSKKASKYAYAVFSSFETNIIAKSGIDWDAVN